MHCYYCDRIAAADASFIPRPAEFDLGSEAPRCAYHWRYVCDHCGQPGHFAHRFYCPSSDRILCRDAGAVSLREGACGPWHDWWVIACPECGEEHPSLDRAELEGSHPWQRDEVGARSRRWLSPETHLTRYPPRTFPQLDAASLTDRHIDHTWSQNADTWDAGYDERGDLNRRYFSDPVLLAFLGDVSGRRILDAGSGAGYLSRLLARSGAHVTAVENARRFYEIALGYQAQQPLPIEFHHASISNMSFLPDAFFDAAVANYVLMDVRDYEAAVSEIARVLKPGGSFVFAVVHNTIEGHWHMPAPDSPRRTDRTYWMDTGYFVRRAGWIHWGDIEPFITFHRPLRDYVAACKRAGLELRDLEEPEISEEGRRAMPRSFVEHAQQAAVSYVLKFVRRYESSA